MDRKSAIILGVILGGLFLALFGFLLLAFLVVRAGQEGGDGFAGGPSIGVLEITGTIESSDKSLKHLRRFAKDDRVKAILVRVDSPGGAVAPSQEIYTELRKMAEKRKVICSLGNVAASGGYYIAAGCEKIIASPGTITGSIGVVSQLPYLGDIARELKFHMVTIKSGKLKDMGNPFREMTEEERAYFQKMLDDVHEQFIQAVAEGRGLEVEQVRPIADGRILTGQQAKELNLIDEIGSFNDAIRLAAALTGIEGEPRLQYPPEDRVFPFDQWIHEGARAAAKGLREELAGSAGAGISGPAYLMPMPSTAN
jgi:protease-4